MDDPKALILNVDDHAPARYIRTRILRRAGFEVIEAGTGAEALELARSRRPAVILLDVNLPDKSGFDVCRELKLDPATSSILIAQVSATAIGESQRVAGLESGADNYLIEPVPENVLLASVNALLRMRRAEEAVRSLAREWQVTFDAINDGVCLVDRRGRIMRCNRALAELVGKEESDVPGTHYTDHELLARVPFEEASASRRREQGELPFGDRWLDVTLDPVLDGDDELTGLVCIFSDITESRRHREETAALLEREQELRGLAEEANRSKDEFLATISHELRTPLQGIIGWLWVLRRSRGEGEQFTHAVESIERGAKAQAQIIEDLIEISRIITGRVRLEKTPLSLARVFTEAIEAARPTAGAKGLDLRVSLEEVDDVIGDPDRLRQVLSNLLSNAVKFTPAGGTIECRLTQEDETALVSIRDTGPGLSPDLLARIFERFQQADSSPTRAHSGLGLGLAIARHLVELHGGKIEAQSEGEGKGAVFSVRMPLASLEDLAEPGKRTRRKPEASEERPRRVTIEGLNVVLVEDEENNRDVLRIVLEEAGARVIAVSTAARALEVVKESPPDVLVSDIAMPDEDGYTLIRKVRSLSGAAGSVPAVALTAFAREEERTRALLAGYEAHVAKPVEPGDLVETIGDLARPGASSREEDEE